MGLIDAIQHANTVALDTPALIYYFEDRGERAEQLAGVFERIDAGLLTAVVSVISVTEILTGPLKAGLKELATTYRQRLSMVGGVQLLAVNLDIAELAADVRVAYNLRTPDALIVATARFSGCSHLVTNDASLKKVEQPQVLVIDEFVGG